jgi:hypothetical protein
MMYRTDKAPRLELSRLTLLDQISVALQRDDPDALVGLVTAHVERLSPIKGWKEIGPVIDRLAGHIIPEYRGKWVSANQTLSSLLAFGTDVERDALKLPMRVFDFLTHPTGLQINDVPPSTLVGVLRRVNGANSELLIKQHKVNSAHVWAFSSNDAFLSAKQRIYSSTMRLHTAQTLGQHSNAICRRLDIAPSDKLLTLPLSQRREIAEALFTHVMSDPTGSNADLSALLRGEYETRR